MKVKPNSEQLLADLCRLMKEKAEHVGCNCASSSSSADSSSESSSESSSADENPSEGCGGAAAAAAASSSSGGGASITVGQSDAKCCEMLRQLRDGFVYEHAANQYLERRLKAMRRSLKRARERHVARAGPPSRRCARSNAQQVTIEALREQLSTVKIALDQNTADSGEAQSTIAVATATAADGAPLPQQPVVSADVLAGDRPMPDDRDAQQEMEKKVHVMSHQLQQLQQQTTELRQQLVSHAAKTLTAEQESAELRSELAKVTYRAKCTETLRIAAADQLKAELVTSTELRKQLVALNIAHYIQPPPPVPEVNTDAKQFRCFALQMQRDTIAMLLPLPRHWTSPGVPKNKQLRYADTSAEPSLEQFKRVQKEVQRITVALVKTNHTRRNRLRNLYRCLNKMDDRLMALPGMPAVWDNRTQPWVKAVQTFVEYTYDVRERGSTPGEQRRVGVNQGARLDALKDAAAAQYRMRQAKKKKKGAQQQTLAQQRILAEQQALEELLALAQQQALAQYQVYGP